MLLNLNQWFGLNTRWPFSNYVSRMPGLDKYLVSSQKWEHYKLYLVPYCCFNSISVFHQQGSSHSLEIWNISTLSWKEPIFQLIKTVTIFLFHDLPWWWSVQQFQEVIRTSCVWTLSNFTEEDDLPGQCWSSLTLTFESLLTTPASASMMSS